MRESGGAPEVYQGRHASGAKIYPPFTVESLSRPTITRPAQEQVNKTDEKFPHSYSFLGKEKTFSQLLLPGSISSLSPRRVRQCKCQCGVPDPTCSGDITGRPWPHLRIELPRQLYQSSAIGPVCDDSRTTFSLGLETDDAEILGVAPRLGTRGWRGGSGGNRAGDEGTKKVS